MRNVGALCVRGVRCARVWNAVCGCVVCCVWVRWCWCVHVRVGEGGRVWILVNFFFLHFWIFFFCFFVLVYIFKLKFLFFRFLVFSFQFLPLKN